MEAVWKIVRSSKAAMAIVGAALGYLMIKYGGLAVEEVLAILAPFFGFEIGQGMADFGKNGIKTKTAKKK